METMETMETKKIKLTENCEAALAWLRENDNGEDGHFGVDIATALEWNPNKIQGVMNALVKYGFVGKGKRDSQRVDKDGNSITKNYTFYFVTDAGRAYEA